MEKIIVKEKRYKYVDAGYEDVEIFVSTDGSKWKTEKECLKQDMIILEKKKASEIPKRETYILECPEYWYFPKDEEELEIVKYRLGNGSPKHTHIRGTLGVGMWIGGYTEYGGDNYDKYHVVTLDQYKKEFEEFLSEFED